MLGVDTLPSLQFWKGGEKVWEHKGVVRLQEDLGEGARTGGSLLFVLGWQQSRALACMAAWFGAPRH